MLMGTAVGALLPICLAVAMVIIDLRQPVHRDPPLLGDLGLIAYALLIPAAIVLGSSVVVGLPTAWLLRRFKIEDDLTYGIAGLIFGLAVPIGLLLMINAVAGYWLAIIGPFSGVATALTWWRCPYE